MQRQVIANHRRKQDGIALGIQRLNEVVGIDLIGKRVIQENSMAVLFSCDAFKQTVLDALAVRLELFGGMLLFSSPNQFP